MPSENTSNILIVDDLPMNLEVAASILGPDFPHLSFAHSGEEALATLAAGNVDLVLLDIMMPGIDGFEVCRRIKQDCTLSDIPVIFLTARTDPEGVLEGFDAGGVDYIQKPFDPAELVARVRTHLRLRESEKGLRRLLAEKDRFLDIVAHQIETPFSTLRGVLHTVHGGLDTLPRQEIDEYLELSLQTTDSLAELLRNLLDWSKLHTEGFGVCLQRLSLLNLLEGVARLLGHDMTMKKVRLEWNIPPELAIKGDLEILERALEGLLSNAIKFSPAGGLVEIRGEREGALAHLAIQDHGIGIPARHIDGLFDPLTQLRRAGVQGESGTGLGLPLARALIERSGGSLSIESAEGKGTTAHVRLPLWVEG